jgi:hypothetical protein
MSIYVGRSRKWNVLRKFTSAFTDFNNSGALCYLGINSRNILWIQVMYDEWMNEWSAVPSSIGLPVYLRHRSRIWFPKDILNKHSTKDDKKTHSCCWWVMRTLVHRLAAGLHSPWWKPQSTGTHCLNSSSLPLLLLQHGSERLKDIISISLILCNIQHKQNFSQCG